MHTSIKLIAILLAFAQSVLGQSLSVKLKSDVKKGDKVIGIIDAPGDVGIESDISQSSFLSKGAGKREVDLGNGKTADFGFHRVKVLFGPKTVSILIPVISDKDPVPVPTAPPLSEAESSAIKKYFDALKAKPGHYFDKWPKGKVAAENVVKISYVGTLGLFCAAEPSKLSCVPAAAGVADLGIELALGFAEFAAVEMLTEKTLTKNECDSIKALIVAIKASKSVVGVFTGQVGEKIIEGAELLTIGLDASDNAKLIIGLQKDSAGKAVKLFYFVKKLKP